MNGMLLNIGCGDHYAEGWCNVDVHSGENIHPDVLVSPDDPLGDFPTGCAAKLYAGHVLEHCEWAKVPILLNEFLRVLEPGGQFLAVGPDVFKTLQRWHEGLEPWHMIESVLEHSLHYQSSPEIWPNARHHWNWTLERALAVVTAAGFEQVQELDINNHGLFDGWPVTSFAPWQSALTGWKSS